MIGDRWGVSDKEVARHYPCDEFISKPTLRLWRGVTVRTPPEVLWPWVKQLRLAPYSYDWIDNRGHTSPQTIVELPEPHVGAPYTAVGGREVGSIVSVQQGSQLTGMLGGDYMSYVLAPEGEHATRLLLKVVMAPSRWLAPALSVGDLIMARRQLLNLKTLAEQHSPQQGDRCNQYRPGSEA